ncbi:MAG TPA: endopeptidase La [Thermodesulfobacteriota bacterium]|nr:endopeptidase La [Thermodesulfobacteriota bacterium]
MENLNDRGKKFTVSLLPLRDIILFPHMVAPLLVGRDRSIRAIESSMEKDQRLFFVLQRVTKVNDPREDDLHMIGTLGTAIQFVKLSDGTVKVLAEGECRGRLLRLIPHEPYALAEVEEIETFSHPTLETEAMMRSVVNLFGTYAKLAQRGNSELLASLSKMDDPDRLTDTMVVHISLKLEDKQRLLEILRPEKRLEELYRLLRTEIEILQMEHKIRERVKKQMEKSQKEYYLNEQMRAIQKELGDKDDFSAEMRELESKIKEKKMSKEATQKVEKEFKKLKLMPPMSAEATVVRNYIDWFLSLPWSYCTKDKLDLTKAEKILDEDHYGLKEVKERILEYLAVQGLVKKIKGPILCFVGPPGVGKTSLAKSIARSMGRRFVRLSLGGVRDEAEIRGHRRTYVGALPGKIIQSIKKAGANNPVFLLDEVDKMSTDFRGDPSAALLEVLDPEQNHTFNDHYLDVDYDLSKVFFITTANTLYSIPPPLQDRMEVIRIAGYTEPEKVQIAQKFIVPKQIKANGLAPENIHFSDAAIRKMIQGYTRESGVRNLEREIASICRKMAKKVLKEGKEVSVRITAEGIERYLGVPKFRYEKGENQSQVGLANGLAWTEVGGELLTTEVTVMQGKGNLIITGKLGEVMQESAQAAMSYVRSRAERLGLEKSFYQRLDTHIHIPEGAIPKDGPSAGITMATAIVSAHLKVPVRSDLAMTGEITLRGRVLPIGGLKEKILAAHRAGIKRVLIPKDNEKDIKEIPVKILKSIELIQVDHMDEVLRRALVLDHPEHFLAPKPKDVTTHEIEMDAGVTA